MNWSHELPSKPGWYWFVPSEGAKPIPVQVGRGWLFRNWYALLYGWDKRNLRACTGFWSPLPEPPAAANLDWSLLKYGQTSLVQ